MPLASLNPRSTLLLCQIFRSTRSLIVRRTWSFASGSYVRTVYVVGMPWANMLVTWFCWSAAGACRGCTADAVGITVLRRNANSIFLFVNFLKCGRTYMKTNLRTSFIRMLDRHTRCRGCITILPPIRQFSKFFYYFKLNST